MSFNCLYFKQSWIYLLIYWAH